jgi:hypothetical protein
LERICDEHEALGDLAIFNSIASLEITRDSPAFINRSNASVFKKGTFAPNEQAPQPREQNNEQPSLFQINKVTRTLVNRKQSPQEQITQDLFYKPLFRNSSESKLLHKNLSIQTKQRLEKFA